MLRKDEMFIACHPKTKRILPESKATVLKYTANALLLKTGHKNLRHAGADGWFIGAYNVATKEITLKYVGRQ